jgi:uncharacterized protein (TIGR00369 family)
MVTYHDARQVLEAQPFSRLLGARLTEFTPGHATLEIEVDDRLRQQFGLLHGGVLAYAADNVVTFAGGSVLGPSVVTAGMTISYLRPVRDGVLRATATVAHDNRRQAVCTSELHAVAPDGSAELCAVAQGTVTVTGTAEHRSPDA